MSKSQKSLATKPRIAIVVIVVALILSLPLLSHYASHAASKALVHGNAQTDPARALVWYKVAATLAPHDPNILEKLAGSDLQNGSDNDALTAATRSIAHGAGSTGDVLESQALLELGQNDTAIQAAQTAVQTSTDQAAQVQLGLAYATAGNDDRLAATIGLLGTSTAAQTLSSVEHNHFTLAQGLYVRGLLRSSQRILTKYQVGGSQSYLLQAQIALQLGHNDKNSLEQGRGLLDKAIMISPERVDLRQALQSIDQKLGDDAAAGEQGSKTQALETGKV